MPDLTFAELNFLSKRRQDNVQNKKADGRKDKTKQSAANDISNYFSRAMEHLDERVARRTQIETDYLRTPGELKQFLHSERPAVEVGGFREVL